jgi:hypothetical protein
MMNLLDSKALASKLIDHLGITLTTAIGGAEDIRIARGWASGERRPKRSRALKAALQAASAISAAHDNETARSWFTSINANLGCRSPLVFLRAALHDDDFDHLVRVAVQDAS